MGLDTSHNAWHGPYSAFHRFRTEIAKLAGLPPLDIMEGFYYKDGYNNPLTLLNYKYPNGDELDMSQIRRIFSQLPIKWDCLKKSPLHELLYHSDCDGEIEWQKCKGIANELKKLVPLMEKESEIFIRSKDFIKGLNLAHKLKENLEFR